MNTSTKSSSIAPPPAGGTISTTTSSKYNYLPKFNSQQQSNNQQYNNTNNTTQPNQPPPPPPPPQQQHTHHQSRVFSNDVIDSLANSLSFNRTVSSSSSILSTPSNNIRKYQRQQQQQQQQQPQDSSHNQTQLHPKRDIHPRNDSKQKGIEKNGRISRNGQLIKNKLLNIHQSHKQLHPSSNTTVQQKQEEQQRQSLRPKQSRSHAQQEPPQKVTHDAAYYARKVIFGNDTSDSEEEEQEEEEEDDTGGEEEKCLPIRSIPGYTRGELQLLLKQPTHAQLSEDEEKRLLLDHKRKLMSKQERYFMKSHALAIRRQVQVSQKKDVLEKIFGDSNMLIGEYMTNNSEYSALDHSFNIHKVLNEDNEEITNLLEEDTWFQASMEEFRTLISRKKQSYVLCDGDNGEQPPSYKITVPDLISKFEFHEASADAVRADDDDDDDDDVDMASDRNEELYQLGLSHLKAICKKEREESGELQY
ncbi:hypothetical protein KGF57_001644 [Candida theae]|uniref:Uncharacterized protein n=1 Tax=Candida theae TaxID=1198502 RepID=A0AAD5BGM9_9ASCO|nr:uncharacterized protein KGF57_001644 [Candida theae]KAI5961710.1 hypothetical protein KGF57_001644 [Candida theae]